MVNAAHGLFVLDNIRKQAGQSENKPVSSTPPQLL